MTKTTETNREIDRLMRSRPEPAPNASVYVRPVHTQWRMMDDAGINQSQMDVGTILFDGLIQRADLEVARGNDVTLFEVATWLSAYARPKMARDYYGRLVECVHPESPMHQPYAKRPRIEGRI